MTAGAAALLGFAVTAILAVCVTVFTYTTRRWKHRLVSLLLLFPLLTQLWMITSVGTIFGVLLVVAAGLGAVAVGLITSIMLIVQLVRRNHASASMFITFVISVCVIAAIFASIRLSDYQRTGNNERGSRIGEAIQRYHEDNGHYPRELNELHGKYLDSVPMWRHGLLPLPFIYWLDSGDKPNLKYVPAPWTGVFYSFEDGTWYSSTLY